MNVTIENENINKFHNLSAGDIFNIDDEWFILVQSKEGYSISSMNQALYMNYKIDDTRHNYNFETVQSLEELLIEMEKECDVEYYSKSKFNFDLTIRSK